MVISFLGAVALALTHVMTGHVIHRWMWEKGVPVPPNTGALVGAAYAAYCLLG